jgi:hypothetical protein
VLIPTQVGLGLSRVAANVTDPVPQRPGYLGGVVGFRSVLAGQGRRILVQLGLVVAGARSAACSC